MRQIVNFSKEKPFNVVLRSNVVSDYIRYDFANYFVALSVFNDLVDSDLDGIFCHIQLRNKTKCIKSFTNFKNV